MREKGPPSTVKDVMTKPIITVDLEGSVREAAEIMSSNRIGCIVITKKGKHVGIATERDLVQRVLAKGLDASKTRIKEIMSQPLITLEADTPIIDAIRMMDKKKIRRLLAVKKGMAIGIITQRDLLRALTFHVLISFRPLLQPKREQK